MPLLLFFQSTIAIDNGYDPNSVGENYSLVGGEFHFILMKNI